MRRKKRKRPFRNERQNIVNIDNNSEILRKIPRFLLTMVDDPLTTLDGLLTIPATANVLSTPIR
jgi:hypothetical protein